MNYCDLHCDTPLELYRCGEGFAKARLNISGDMLRCFDSYVQVCAYCAPESLSDGEGYEHFFAVTDNFTKEISACGGVICTDSRRLSETMSAQRPAFVLSVEDGRILGGDEEKLYRLFAAGVRVMTPLWGGETVIGGSHESAAGLTAFGKRISDICGRLGIITDISHASPKSADQILETASLYGRAVMASHSCSDAVHAHSRNLTDRQAKAVADTGGIIGVNSYPPHLAGDGSTPTDVIRHIYHLVSLVGEDKVALGMDFDGMGIRATRGLENLSYIPALREEMLKSGFSENTCERIFYKNASNFLLGNLPAENASSK